MVIRFIFVSIFVKNFTTDATILIYDVTVGKALR